MSKADVDVDYKVCMREDGLKVLSLACRLLYGEKSFIRKEGAVKRVTRLSLTVVSKNSTAL